MQVQPCAQLIPGSPLLETDNVNGCRQVTQSTISPLPIFLIKFRCTLNDFAVDLLIAEKSSFTMVVISI